MRLKLNDKATVEATPTVKSVGAATSMLFCTSGVFRAVRMASPRLSEIAPATAPSFSSAGADVERISKTGGGSRRSSILLATMEFVTNIEAVCAGQYPWLSARTKYSPTGTYHANVPSAAWSVG